MADDKLATEDEGSTRGTEAGGQSASEALEPETSDQAAEQVSDDLDELGRAQRERDEYLDLAQRTRADFDNYRKRVSKDTADALQRGKLDVARQLIPVIDNLERAMAAGDGASDPAALAKGVSLVHGELREALTRVGLTAFDPAGDRFDPAWHEAISTRAEQGSKPGTVLETLEPGYRLGEQLLRPARVVVSE
ncbi:MAG: nucleotide exchange factor GrpE [Solirubrobacterales bacterium]|nr:nucleotide exchange factor GrpE [Solirubrobacterales bacterium]